MYLQVVLGNLPDDFLRPDTLPGSDSSSEQEIADRELAMQLQQHQWAAQHHPAQNCVGQLIISVVEVVSLQIRFHFTKKKLILSLGRHRL